ncbi:hypothetical protein B0H10DRAFT_2238033 [Mycena sp. CBHHK59/15]|nr:hypothetical protein B0H10DRAFT_2238033 [Mycena sp. CBHHK59/15]
MALCQIFTSLSLPHHHYPAIAPASPRSNMLARRSPDGRKPAGKRPYGVVATPVRSAFPAAGENWSTRARVPERRRLNRVQEWEKTYPWNWFIFAPALLPDPPSKTPPKMLSEDARMTGSGSDQSFKGAEVEERVVFVFSNVLQCAVPSTSLIVVEHLRGHNPHSAPAPLHPTNLHEMRTRTPALLLLASFTLASPLLSSLGLNAHAPGAVAARVLNEDRP